MVNDGYYIIEYNYRDIRGHVRTKRLMRGKFDLIVSVYNGMVKMINENDIHKPITKPRYIKVKDGVESEINFEREYEEWQNLKSNTRKQ